MKRASRAERAAALAQLDRCEAGADHVGVGLEENMATASRSPGGTTYHEPSPTGAR